MADDDFTKFVKAEIKYINDAKWYEGINTHRDPGENFIEHWALDHASEFREKWNMSKCKVCVNGGICGNNLKTECHSFIES